MDICDIITSKVTIKNVKFINPPIEGQQIILQDKWQAAITAVAYKAPDNYDFYEGDTEYNASRSWKSHYDQDDEYNKSNNWQWTESNLAVVVTNFKAIYGKDKSLECLVKDLRKTFDVVIHDPELAEFIELKYGPMEG